MFGIRTSTAALAIVIAWFGFAPKPSGAHQPPQELSGDVESKPFDLTSHFLEDLKHEFQIQGEAQRVNDGFLMSQDSFLRAKINAGPQFGIQMAVDWPEFRIESPTEVNILFIPQGLRDFGFSSIAAGKPCGVSLRTILVKGDFAWEASIRTYTVEGRPIKVLAKKVLDVAAVSNPLRVSYNYGVVKLDFEEDDSLQAHIDNFSAGVKELRVRCLGLPFKLSGIKMRSSKPQPMPSIANRFRLMATAALDHEAFLAYRQSKMGEALELQEKIFDTCFKALGADHLYTIRAGTRLATLYLSTNREDDAKELLANLESHARDAFGPNHPHTVSLITEQAMLRTALGDWNGANLILQKTNRDRLQQRARPYDRYLGDLAADMESDLRWDVALKLREESLESARSAYAANHWRIREAEHRLRATQLRSQLSVSDFEELRKANALLNQVATLMRQGELQSAMDKALQVYTIRKNILGRENRDTALTITYLGMLSGKLGRHEESMKYNEQDIEITRIVQGDEHPEYASVLNNTAQSLMELKQFDRAETLHLKALDIRRKNKADRPNDYAESLTNVGRLLCFSRGRLDKGIPLIEEAYRIRLEHFASDSLEVSTSLSNLGNCYQAVGDYSRAISSFQQSLDIKRKFYGEENLTYANILVALGVSQMSADLPEAAIANLQKATDIIAKRAGRKNKYYPQAVNYLAGAYSDLGQFEKARELYIEALKLRRSQVGEADLDCASIQVNLASVSLQEKQYDRALAECHEAKEIIESTVGRNHPNFSTAEKIEVAILLAKGEHLQRALAINTRLLELEEVKIQQRLAVLSETQQLAHFRSLRTQLFSQLVIGRMVDCDPREIYQHVMAWKSAIGLRAMTDKLANSPELGSLQGQLRTVRARMSDFVYGRKHKNDTDFVEGLKRLEAEKERLQRLIAAASPGRDSVNLTELAGHLPPHGVLVDFLRVGRANGDSRYHAFVISAASQSGPYAVHWVDLGKADEIDIVVALWRKSILSAKENRSLANRLGKSLWDPIELKLGFSPKFAYLCPDSALTAIPWCALPGKRKGSFLIEDTTICMLPFSQYLLLDKRRPSPSLQQRKLLLIGDVDYQSQPVGTHQETLLAKRAGLVDFSRPDAWPALPATREEINSIAKLANPLEVIRLDKTEATISATVPALQSADYVHIASHGFFQRSSDAKDDEDMVSWNDTLTRNPLLLSGVVLSGANSVEDNKNHGVGLLSAEEIASLPLDQLQLVTLSACETGIGKVAGGEGVFSLQRAFHLAGSKNVVASLWQVEDQATAALMELFYHYMWKNKLPPAEAMRQAQLTMLRNPTVIKDAGARSQSMLRGPNIKSTVKLPNETDDPAVNKNAQTQQWAAFSVSGRYDLLGE